MNSTAFPLEFLKNSFPGYSLNEWLIARLKYKDVWFVINSNGKNYELHLENIEKFKEE